MTWVSCALRIASVPNKGLELTAYSVRSCVAPASSRSSGPALGARGAEGKTQEEPLETGASPGASGGRPWQHCSKIAFEFPIHVCVHV